MRDGILYPQWLGLLRDRGVNVEQTIAALLDAKLVSISAGGSVYVQVGHRGRWMTQAEINLLWRRLEAHTSTTHQTMLKQQMQAAATDRQRRKEHEDVSWDTWMQ